MSCATCRCRCMQRIKCCTQEIHAEAGGWSPRRSALPTSADIPLHWPLIGHLTVMTSVFPSGHIPGTILIGGGRCDHSLKTWLQALNARGAVSRRQRTTVARVSDPACNHHDHQHTNTCVQCHTHATIAGLRLIRSQPLKAAILNLASTETKPGQAQLVLQTNMCNS